MKDGFPVSVAELIASGARPLPGEAVAILLDVCEQVVRQPARASVLPAITPSALFLDGSGAVTVAGGVPVEDDQTVRLLGRLLLQLLPPAGTAAATRVPSRLRELASRAAAGEFEKLSVGRLAASLRRFSPEQSKPAVRALFERWCEGNGSAGAAKDFGAASGLRGSESAAPSRLALQEQRRSTASGEEPRRRRSILGKSRRRLVGALVATLLIFASVGAAYWLSADTVLPPVPLSPSLLLSEPPAPPRGGWELLDPAGLAVEARPVALGSQPGPIDRMQKSPAGAQAPENASHKPVQ